MPAIQAAPRNEVTLEYMLVCKDGSRARGPSLELARQRIQRITASPVMMSLRVHPETTVSSNGYLKYPDGYPPEEVDIRKGKEWTAAS